MDPEGQGGFINQAWLQYSEVIHARWAMLGAAGEWRPALVDQRLALRFTGAAAGA